MNNFDRVLVPITWKNEGTEVILKGTFLTSLQKKFKMDI